jgi:hypothetical protein
MQFHFQQSNFGNRYLVANNFKSGLRVANGMESIFPFEPWKAGSFTLLHSSKKMFERNVQSFKNILQNLRVNPIKFRERCFYGWQFILLVLVRNSLTNGFVSSNSMLQRCIVKPPTQIELLVQDFNLRSVGVNSIFICNNHFTKLRISQQVARNYRVAKGIATLSPPKNRT